NRSDGLEVHVLLNCSNDVTGSPKVYDKRGNSLATAPITTLSFNPSGASQWRKEIIDLSNFIGQSSVQLAFVGINDNGNNLYLDNVAFKADVSEDIAVAKITHPSPVHCSDEVQPSLVIQNKGVEAITNFKILYSVNNGNTQTMSVFENFNLSAGAETTITLPVLALVEGENSLAFELVEPNGFGDVNPIDNVKTVKTIFHSAEDKIPLRENFDNEFESQWSIINPEGSVTWEEAATDYNRSLYIDGYSNGSTATGDAWLVSPVLDFSDAVTASVFFDVSYRFKNTDSIREPGEDVFKVLASKDCGGVYDQILFRRNEISLARENSEVAWAPSGPNDWDRPYINLNALAGEKNVRIAFVLTNPISNNLYIDNLEFFVSDNPSPTTITSNLYSLYMDETELGKNFNITFNLDNRQAVTCELVDMMGRQIATKEFFDVLNQTFDFDCQNISTGIYLVRLLIDNTYYVSRILVSQ
ncbi:MAG TPA: choice-of-anchor J domain-containing protein, partial [Chryseolinea sp.]|nr:choice-of-anchor J domain-containing protein [Chryseolinea sp.]